MPAEFDRCVRKVAATGKSKSSAFAICTASFKKAGKKTRENIDDVQMEEESEEELNLETCIVVSENTKILLDATVKIEE